jgi:magnesium transporter
MASGGLALLEEAEFETAGEHVCRDVPIVRPDAKAGEVRRLLTVRRFESAVDIAVCEAERLAGLIRIEDLLAAPEGTLARDLMDESPPIVAPGLDQEVAAWRAVRQEERSLAVVRKDGTFVGLIPPDRLLRVLLWEHEEDLARLGGFLPDTESARAASEEPVARRFWHRMPWLLLGLAGSVLAADIVGRFERELEANVILAFFIPGIVYMADAVGTQTETLVIRGLSVNVPVGRVLRRELLTGLLVGAAIALIFLPVGLLRWGETEVAVAVSLALLAACSTATVVAMALPWLLSRLGRDPAFGSGPLATVVQDLLSILIYFGIVVAVV